MKKYLLCVFGAMNLIFLSHNATIAYKFKTEYVDDMEPHLKGYNVALKTDSSPIKGLYYKDFEKVCLDAGSDAKLDMTNDSIDILTSSDYNFSVILKCNNTVPKVYAKSNYFSSVGFDEWTIVLKKNKFLSQNGEYKFIEKTAVINEPQSCSSVLKNDPLNFDLSQDSFAELVQLKCFDPVKGSLLSKMQSTELLDLCLAAKSKLKKNFAFSSNEVDTPQRYAFIYDKHNPHKSTRRVAIKCPSAELMYIYFKNLRDNENEIIATFYENTKY